MPAERAGDGYFFSPPGVDPGNVSDAGLGHCEHDGTGAGPVDFFISYAEVDVEWAEWVAWVLEDAGYTTRIQAWDFATGNGFVKEMHDGAQVSDRTIAMLSNAYLGSRYAEAEWQAAWASDPSGRRRKLLAARTENCAQPGLLKQLLSVDLFGVDRDTAASRLLRAAQGARGKPAAEPAFPGSAQRPQARTGAEPTFPGDTTLPLCTVPGRKRPAGSSGRRRPWGTRRMVANAVACAGGVVVLMFAMIIGVGGCFGGGLTGGNTGLGNDAHGDSSQGLSGGTPDPQPNPTASSELAFVGQRGSLTGDTPPPGTASAGAPGSGASAGSVAGPTVTSVSTNPGPPVGGTQAPQQQAPRQQAPAPQAGPSSRPAASPTPTNGCQDGVLEPLLDTLSLVGC